MTETGWIRAMRTSAAAIALVVPALFASGAAPAGAAPYDFTMIAQTGTTTGAFGAFDTAPSINGSGTVSFSTSIYNVGTVGVYTGNGATTANVISSDPNTGTSIFLGQTDINNNGQVGYLGTVNNQSGFWVNTGGSNANIIPGSFGVIQGQPALNNAGTVAAYVQQINPANTEGVYTSSDGVTLTQIVNQPVNSGLLNNPAINDAGQVAFTNTDGNGNPGIYLTTGNVTVQVVDVTTAGLQNNSLSNPRLDSSGRVIFQGQLTTGQLGVFLASGGTVSTLMTAGSVGGQIGGFGGTLATNNADEVAFRASVIGGPIGIFTGTDPVLDKVIATGDTLFGATVIDIQFGSGSLNDAGQIAFRATLDDGRTVIARADPLAASAAVPEPAAWTILVFGLVALVTLRRLRAA